MSDSIINLIYLHELCKDNAALITKLRCTSVVQALYNPCEKQDEPNPDNLLSDSDIDYDID